MHTAFVYDPRFLDHETGAGHPERPERVRAVTDGLQRAGLWDRLGHVAFAAAERGWIERLHERAYVDRCFEACRSGQPYIDSPDSAIGPESAAVAQLASGGALAAVERVVSGEARNAFCAMRPPGHHAEADRSLGFCLFNHVALAAEYARVQHGFERIAIVDFDVHHGNGTQHLFEHRSDVFYISLHQHPDTLFPGTGFEHERGRGEGEGYTLNIPLPPHSGDAEYQQAMEQTVGPALAAYAPQLMLLSAGFDAAGADPLAQMNVTAEGFDWISRYLVDRADQLCAGQLVSVLEGGYDLEALAQSVIWHVGALLHDQRAAASG